VVTNEVGNDPDIKTSPLFIFFNKLPLHWFNRFQHIYYLPVLSTLDFYWHVETWMTTIKHLLTNTNVRELQIAKYDAFMVGLWDLMFAFWIYQQGWFYPMFCLWISGTGTALVVFSTHYAEDRLDNEHELSFMEQTFRTSRNIKGFFGENWFWNYLTNNLSLQKEHHLFPRMPNVYLRRISPEIRSLGKRLGFGYTEDNIVQCTLNAMKKLKESTFHMP
jgi:fatty acid desaturase